MLKLQEGKYYKTRSGDKAGPMMTHIGKYPFLGKFNGSDAALYEADGTCPHIPERDLIAEWTEGPVRTVTRREIVPGVYANLKVDLSPSRSHVCVGIGIDSRLWSAAELKAAAAVLLELVGALEGE